MEENRLAVTENNHTRQVNDSTITLLVDLQHGSPIKVYHRRTTDVLYHSSLPQMFRLPTQIENSRNQAYRTIDQKVRLPIHKN